MSAFKSYLVESSEVQKFIRDRVIMVRASHTVITTSPWRDGDKILQYANNELDLNTDEPGRVGVKFDSEEEIKMPDGVIELLAKTFGVDKLLGFVYLGGVLRDPKQQFMTQGSRSLCFMKTAMHTLSIDPGFQVKKLVISKVDLQCGLLGLLKSKAKEIKPTAMGEVLGAGKGLADFLEAINIVQKHMDGDRDLAECAEDLIDAGFEEYAKL